MQHIKTIVLLVTVFFISACEDILEVSDISDENITILAPQDGSSIKSNRISFNWNLLMDATNYQVQIAAPNFESANQILLDTLFTQDTLGVIANRIERSLLNGNYEWRVRAFNSAYETLFSQSRFIVDGDVNADIISPSTPMLLSPINEAVQEEPEVQFTWSREDISGTAERDSIYIFTDEALENLHESGLGANKAYEITLATNTYYWYVKAFDEAGNMSDSSVTYSLTIN